jgi:hypothetical protein
MNVESKIKIMSKSKNEGNLLILILLLILLCSPGCSTPQPADPSFTEHQVTARITQLLVDYPQSTGYVQRVTETLEALAALPERVSPEFVRNAVAAIPAENYGSGQYQARAANEARRILTQILRDYKTADRQRLAAIAAGLRAGGWVR